MGFFARLGRRQRLLLAGSALLLILVPLFIPLPPATRHDPTLTLIGDRIHIVLFAGLVVLLHAWGPVAGRPVAAAVLAAVTGAASEFLQQFVGRSPLVADFALDLIGIGLALTVIQWRRGRRRAVLAAAAFLAATLAWSTRDAVGTWRAMLAVRQSYPLLATFEQPLETNLWDDRGSDMTLLEVGGDHGTVLRVSTSGDDNWPGVAARHLPPDWSGYRQLAFACRLRSPAPDSLRLAVRIDDYQSRDDGKWASRSWYVTHEWRTIRYPLTGLSSGRDGRLIDLTDVFALTIFLARPGVDAAFELDDVRLSRLPTED